MVTEQQIINAAFWEEEWICLHCGTCRADEGEDCCDAPQLVEPKLALIVLAGVVREGEGFDL